MTDEALYVYLSLTLGPPRTSHLLAYTGRPKNANNQDKIEYGDKFKEALRGVFGTVTFPHASRIHEEWVVWYWENRPDRNEVSLSEILTHHAARKDPPA
jgi:hypothetical protein